MKKVLCLILVLLMCVSMLAACGNKDDADDGKEGGDPAENPTLEPVKLTDKFSFADPTDLEFDTRYVLYYGPDNMLVMASADDGMLAEYTIIYARGEKAVAEYTFYILDTAENAKALYNEMESYARTPEYVEGDDTIIVDYTDEYALEANLDIFVMGELLTDTKVTTYVDFYVGYYGAKVME